MQARIGHRGLPLVERLPSKKTAHPLKARSADYPALVSEVLDNVCCLLTRRALNWFLVAKPQDEANQQVEECYENRNCEGYAQCGRKIG